MPNIDKRLIIVYISAGQAADTWMGRTNLDYENNYLKVVVRCAHAFPKLNKL